ncbi:MAG: hypothetical protein IJE16_00415 [Ruminococcus sp.]|nr:hypothetical protein [Ruminococcus sp.]
MLSDRFFRMKKYILSMIVFCGIVAFFLLLYFGFTKRTMIMVTNKISIADFVDLLGSGSFMNILLIPICVFFTTTISEYNSSSFNYYIRNKSRTDIFLKRFAKILIASVAIVVFILLISVATAGLFTAEFINWNNYDSYFYLSRKMLLNIDFINLMLCSFAKLFFPITFFSCLGSTISIVCKKTISFLIIILISTSNVFGYIKLFIDNKFINYNFSTGYYLSFSSIVLIFIIFPLMTLITLIVTVKLAKRKDLLN